MDEEILSLRFDFGANYILVHIYHLNINTVICIYIYT